MQMDDPMDNLTSGQMEELRRLLEMRRGEVERGLAASVEDARPVGLDLAIGRLTRVDALQQQHMAMARRERLRTQQALIQQAEARMASGRYGECVRCEEPIGYARLSARPEAAFCLSCQDVSGR
jgi:DnaK suppressor protein